VCPFDRGGKSPNFKGFRGDSRVTRIALLGPAVAVRSLPADTRMSASSESVAAMRPVKGLSMLSSIVIGVSAPSNT